MFFILFFLNVVYYKLRDKIVVQSLVINIGTCLARSYNVFLVDDLSYGNVFLEKHYITITEIVRSKNIEWFHVARIKVELGLTPSKPNSTLTQSEKHEIDFNPRLHPDYTGVTRWLS